MLHKGHGATNWRDLACKHLEGTRSRLQALQAALAAFGFVRHFALFAKAHVHGLVAEHGQAPNTMQSQNDLGVPPKYITHRQFYCGPCTAALATAVLRIRDTIHKLLPAFVSTPQRMINRGIKRKEWLRLGFLS